MATGLKYALHLFLLMIGGGESVFQKRWIRSTLSQTCWFSSEIFSDSSASLGSEDKGQKETDTEQIFDQEVENNAKFLICMAVWTGVHISTIYSIFF